jgi:hypothetical protein
MPLFYGRLARPTHTGPFKQAQLLLLRRARRQKSKTQAAWALRDDGLLFDFEIFVDVFTFDAQLARTLAVGTRNTLEPHG